MYSHIRPSLHSSKPTKKRLTKDQLRLLESSFNANQKLKGDLKLELALQLGLPPKQVAIWYQNRRARHKNHAIEHDYKNLQQELDNVTTENIRLEKEIDILRHELNKARRMLLLMSAPSAAAAAAALPSVSASCSNDCAGSSSPGNMIWKEEDAGIFSAEELCSLIGSEGSLHAHSRTAMISWLHH